MVTPHDIGQKGEVGEMHDGREDRDHEAELRKAGQEKGEAHEENEARPHEEY